RSFRSLLDTLEDSADRIALMEVFAVVLLAVGNDCLRFAELVEHDHELAALDLLDLSGKKVSDSAGELVADLRSLAFPNALNDALLGRLYSRAPKLREIDRNLHLVADLELLVLEPCFLE